MPQEENTVKITRQMRMLCKKTGMEALDTACPPMSREKVTVAVVMLVTMPSVRMVPIIPEATPYWLGPTLPMMTTVLGVTKMPMPRPMSMTSATICQSGVAGPMVQAASSRPRLLRPMPRLDRRTGGPKYIPPPARPAPA